MQKEIQAFAYAAAATKTLESSLEESRNLSDGPAERRDSKALCALLRAVDALLWDFPRQSLYKDLGSRSILDAEPV